MPSDASVFLTAMGDIFTGISINAVVPGSDGWVYMAGMDRTPDPYTGYAVDGLVVFGYKDGRQAWKKKFNQDGFSGFEAITFKDGYVYVAGAIAVKFTEIVNDFDQNLSVSSEDLIKKELPTATPSGVELLKKWGIEPTFPLFMKLEGTTGNVALAKVLDSDLWGDDRFRSIAIDNSGSIYVAGGGWEPASLDDYMLGGTGAAYVRKYSANAELLWQLDGDHVVINPHDGFAYIIGGDQIIKKISDTDPADPAIKPSIISTIDTSLDSAWVRNWIFDEFGNVYIVAAKYIDGKQAGIISKVSIDGHDPWVREIRASISIMPNTIAFDQNGNLLVGGSIEGVLLPEKRLISSGASDGFMMNINRDGEIISTDIIGGIKSESINSLVTIGEDLFIGGLFDVKTYSLVGRDEKNLYLVSEQGFTLIGNGEENYIQGSSGNDKILGLDGNDELFGGDGNDSVNGGTGDDVIVGGHGAGNDTYIGGVGIDTVAYRSAEAGLAINLSLTRDHAKSLLKAADAGIGVDQLFGIENIIGGYFSDWIIGNAVANELIGLDGDDVIDGGAGLDTLIGGQGNDVYVVDNPGDKINELPNDDIDTVKSSVISLNLNNYENIENISIFGSRSLDATGNIGVNVLRGNSASNVLDGQRGADTLEGGAGNDTYIVYGEGETITDTAGTDLVRSYATWTLAAGLENLTLLDGAVINGFGNAANNVITGNSSDNLLSSYGGNDTLIGGAGHDTLDGGVGADRMNGGTGNDVYVIDSARDVILEKAGEGTDTILTTLTSFSLAQFSAIENLTFIGSGGAALIGNALANTLTGSTGKDTLNGFGGADVMIGGADADTYFVDNVGDSIVENENEGIDVVQSSISFSLSAFDYVENLILTGRAVIDGTGNALSNLIRGNGAGNQLFGGAGVDTIYGEAGNDWLSGFLMYDDLDLNDGNFSSLIDSQSAISDHLYGGKGDDVYLLDRLVGRPTIYENLNEGNDTVLGDLPVYTLPNHVENYVNDLNLTENGLPVAISVTGNDLINILKSSSTTWNNIKGILSTVDNSNDAKEEFYGLGGNDTILAGGGDDILSGGMGQDRLTGGVGLDQFVFNTPLNARTNLDTITDFESGVDKLVLDDVYFTSLSNGFSSENLVINTTGRAADDNDYLIFNSRSKVIFYDADGIGTASAPIAFAVLSGVTDLSLGDFWIV